jgi:hypothetical protein
LRPRCSRGLARLPSLPRPAATSPAHRDKQRPPATKATGLHTPLQKKKNSRESAQDRCRRCRKSGACLFCRAPVPQRQPLLPGRGLAAPRALPLSPVRGLPALRALALPGPPPLPVLPPWLPSVAHGCRGGGGGGRGVAVASLFLCVARSCLKRSWGRRAQPGGGWSAHRGATGAPARLLGRGHWHCARWLSLLFLPGPPAHRDSTGPGNKSNGPPQPSPKKENTGEACGDTLLLLPCGCRCCRAVPLRAPSAAAVPRWLPLALRASAAGRTVGCRSRPCPAAAVGCRVRRSSTQGAATEATGFPSPLQEGV